MSTMKVPHRTIVSNEACPIENDTNTRHMLLVTVVFGAWVCVCWCVCVFVCVSSCCPGNSQDTSDVVSSCACFANVSCSASLGHVLFLDQGIKSNAANFLEHFDKNHGSELMQCYGQAPVDRHQDNVPNHVARESLRHYARKHWTRDIRPHDFEHAGHAANSHERADARQRVVVVELLREPDFVTNVLVQQSRVPLRGVG